MVFNYIFDLNYEDISLDITLPTPIEHKNEEDANQMASELKISLVLFPQYMILTDGNNNSLTYLDRDKDYFKISKLKVECIKRLGKPLSPNDITQLQEKDMLESVIFSNKYMINPILDYEVVEWTIGELYQYLMRYWLPKVEYNSQKGFSFDCLACGVSPVKKWKGPNNNQY